MDYPSGDDIRFNIFNPSYFGFKDYSRFNFSIHYFSPVTTESNSNTATQEMDTGEKMNCELWSDRCKNIPSLLAIHEGVYGSGNDLNNPFVKYLYLNKDTEAITYLNFARKCTSLDDFFIDPWERNENVFIPQRLYYGSTAIAYARETKDESIRLRFAFQAIRLAYYAKETEKIKSTYAEFFSHRKKKNIIDYWAMYFRALVEPKGKLKNYYAALVFKNAPDKRFMISMEYDKSIPINQTLGLAKNKDEKYAIWLLSGIRTPGRALECMKHLAALNTTEDGLSFLLLREINKLEDWIFTPNYTNFQPSIEIQYGYRDQVSYSKMQSRILKDRIYASQVLDFVTLNQTKIKDRKLFWQTTQTYLEFMTQDYSTALTQIRSLQRKNIKNDTILNLLEMMKALCLTAAQPVDSAIILNEIKPILMKQFSLSNQDFILAVARELEFKKNRTDAALLFSKLNPNADSYWWDDEHYIFWKNKKKKSWDFTDYYTNYFSYLDGGYTSNQIKNLIIAIENNALKLDSFSVWKFGHVKNQLSRLYDLLGTKYIRENKLKEALLCFEKVNDTLWTSKHEPFITYLNANPFYTNFYNGHRKTKADTISYNKESITHSLINYLKMAENLKNKNRDYYYFLVANCYFNMTYYGNSWMMRRYWSTSTRAGSDLTDGIEYFSCNFAKEYYLKAQSVTKSKKFSALCLRMAGRCEKYRLIYSMNNNESYYLPSDTNSKKIFNANIYFRIIKKQYPEYYDDLVSNCNSFDQYFSARD